ncbi:MAG TPA: vitamin K epoxide reductase family protein [Candidatus Binatia bacterium]|nr:vitamin K epoxide reductase family protein [Candidatus Binatia bacterium]
MAHPARDKKVKAKPVEQRLTQDGPNWPILALAVIGMGLTGYLTYSAWAVKQVAGCVEGSACDVVLSSQWSSLFGLPTSFWGFLTYALLAAIAWNKRTAAQWKAAWFVALFGVLYSVYLTAVSFYVLEAACPYCLTSLGLMAAIFAIAFFQRPARMAGFSWGPWLAKSGGTALVLIAALHLHYAGYWGKTAAAEDPWIRGLATHLAKIDAKFYGASWCPHCKQQKEMFGGSADRVPYIECSPGGPRGPVAQACKDARIESYPTWIINGQRYDGTQTLQALAQFSDYKHAGGKP